MAERERYFTIQCDDYHAKAKYKSLESAKQVVWQIRKTPNACRNDHWINEFAWRDGRYALIQIHEVDQTEPERGAQV